MYERTWKPKLLLEMFSYMSLQMLLVESFLGLARAFILLHWLVKTELKEGHDYALAIKVCFC